jgi:hypothetical protein
MGNYRNDIDDEAYDSDTTGDTNSYWGGLADFLRDKRKLAGLTPLGEALARAAPSSSSNPFVGMLANALDASNNSADSVDQPTQRNQIQGDPFGGLQQRETMQDAIWDRAAQQGLGMDSASDNWGATTLSSNYSDGEIDTPYGPVRYASNEKLRTPVLRAGTPNIRNKKINEKAKSGVTKPFDPTDVKTCKGNFEFSAIGPDQALGTGALGLGFKPPNDTVAIDPARFGLPYTTIAERVATQKLLRDIYGKIQVSAPGLSNHLTGGTTFSISDVGDEIIRKNKNPRFDIYRFVTQKEAEKFGRVKGMETVITGVPAAWKCPK